jgi:hypothetical protein
VTELLRFSEREVSDSQLRRPVTPYSPAEAHRRFRSPHHGCHGHCSDMLMSMLSGSGMCGGESHGKEAMRECLRSGIDEVACSGSASLPQKLRGLSPRANYTDRATAACQRSDYQLLPIEGAAWSA